MLVFKKEAVWGARHILSWCCMMVVVGSLQVLEDGWNMGSDQGHSYGQIFID
jgi:hypothetical protein